MGQTDFPLIVTGAGGRVGQLLRRAMPEGRVTWATRKPVLDGDLAWDDLLLNAPDGGVILHFAGAVGGDLGINTQLARQVCALSNIRHVFVASTAAVYRPMANDLDEGIPADPQNAYGAAKLAMETAVQGAGVTLLRIGNVAGADALLGGIVQGKTVILDPLPAQAGGPVRSYIGPVTLAQTLMRLAEYAAVGAPLPQVLNVAARGAVAMADLLNAAGADWIYGPQKPGVVPRVVLDVSRLNDLVPVPAANATDLVAEWRSAQ